jgi:hypothetical protein
MIGPPDTFVDERDAAMIFQELLSRRLGYVPEWQLPEGDAGRALAWIFSRYVQAVIQRLNQAPEKNRLAFFDLLGLDLTSAQSARAPVVFQLSEQAIDSRAPAKTQLAAPPPPEQKDQVVFETERAIGIAAAKLTDVWSLWPGRDQYCDHSTAFLTGQAFQLFRKPLLENTPHEIYLAHDTLLALAGEATVKVTFELTQSGDEPLAILWEYWDGKVWRGFKSVRPACSAEEAEQADSTRGLTQSGYVQLETDCAETAKTKVNGIEAFWIRGRLNEPLLPESAKALPRVDEVRLGTLIQRTLRATLTPVKKEDKDSGPPKVSRIHGHAVNEAGQALPKGALVKITSPDNPNFQEIRVSIAEDGRYDSQNQNPLTNLAAAESYDVRVAFLKLEAIAKLRNLQLNRDLEVDLTFGVLGLEPDLAYADAAKLDVTKPFFPFGQQPQPGATFYFSQEEVFGKPGATVQIYVARTSSPQDAFALGTNSTPKPPQPLSHVVDWEYWNGQRWITLPLPASTDPSAKPPLKDLTATEIIEFTVPPDMARTKVNDQEGLWVRVRLVSGGFGVTQTVTFNTNAPKPGGGVTVTPNELTYVIPQPPAVAAFRIGYAWEDGPYHPERVLTYNDFQYEDCTYEAVWPGVTFFPFAYVRDVTPTLYLGFDKPLPVDRLGVFFDIVEERGEALGPELIWEYWDGSSWRDLSVDDETRRLRLPGILSFIAAENSQPLARFGTARHWLRGRLKEDGPPGEPTVNGIFPNAVWASQQRTLYNVPLGTSTGLPDQVVVMTQIPVLAGEQIEVQELSGPRANVEWRILALTVTGGDRETLRILEENLGREDVQGDIEHSNLRLRRDRDKRVSEVWVRWQERPHLFFSKADDRHYSIDRARGRVRFGNGRQGMIPPAGATVIAKQYLAGGGQFGNVAARAISQLLSGIPGVQGVFNPRSAEGGADGESLEHFGQRAPRTVRHRGRAVLPADYEALALESSPAVAVARAIPTRNAAGRPVPGWVSLLIIPHTKEPRPWPSFTLREHVRRYVERRAPADLVADRQVYVTGPDYMPVDVKVIVAPVDPAEAGSIENLAREAVFRFLHPVYGGPEGRGLELGRDLFQSDLAAVLERVPGVDYVQEISFSINGRLQGDRVAIAEEHVAVAGEVRVLLKVGEV